MNENGRETKWWVKRWIRNHFLFLFCNKFFPSVFTDRRCASRCFSIIAFISCKSQNGKWWKWNKTKEDDDKSYIFSENENKMNAEKKNVEKVIQLVLTILLFNRCLAHTKHRALNLKMVKVVVEQCWKVSRNVDRLDYFG